MPVCPKTLPESRRTMRIRRLITLGLFAATAFPVRLLPAAPAEGPAACNGVFLPLPPAPDFPFANVLPLRLR